MDVRMVTSAASCDVAQAHGRFCSRVACRGVLAARWTVNPDGRIRSGSALAMPDEPDRLVPADAGDGHAIVY
eukprot:4283132-Prymnesium_polylepis.1